MTFILAVLPSKCHMMQFIHNALPNDIFFAALQARWWSNLRCKKLTTNIIRPHFWPCVRISIGVGNKKGDIIIMILYLPRYRLQYHYYTTYLSKDTMPTKVLTTCPLISAALTSGLICTHTIVSPTTYTYRALRLWENGPVNQNAHTHTLSLFLSHIVLEK